jgi:phosphoribosylanthranilate isomerase
MNIKVKICGITRLQDALDACAMGADLLGFNFVPESKRYVNPYTARDIIASLPPFVISVGIFADEDSAVVKDMAGFLKLDAVQLHGNEDSVYCRGLKTTVIKAVRIGSQLDLDGINEFDVAALLLDSKIDGMLGGSGKRFPWEMASALCEGRRVFVAGGLTPENVREAVRTLSPYGVDTASGVETQPGVKDPVLMEKFITEAKFAAMDIGGKSSDIAFKLS